MNTTPPAPAASAERSTVPAFPGSRTSCRIARQPVDPGASSRPDVEEGRDPDDRLRGDGGGQPAPSRRRSTCATSTPACRARTASGSRSSVGEQRSEPPGLVERLADRLRALDEEPPVLLAERALLQARGGGDLRVLERTSARCPACAGRAKSTCARARGGGLDTVRRRLGGLRLLDERGERRGVVHGQVGEDLAVDLDAGDLQPLMNREYEMPCGRTAALMRAIHSRRNCALRSRRSR